MSRRVGIFWDYENCKPPAALTGAFVASKIRQVVQPLGPTTVFKAYMDTSLEKKWGTERSSVPSELQSSGISLIHCPHNGGKEVADKMLIVDILLFALEHPSSSATMLSTVVLIAGDRDYSYLISTLRLRGHDVILIYPPHSTNRKLVHLPTAVLDWRADVIECPSPEQQLKELLGSGSSYLPSPASSYYSRDFAHSRSGSVSSIEQYQTSLPAKGKQRSSRSSAVLSVSSTSPAPSFDVLDSASERFTSSEDGNDDSESFVCVDDDVENSDDASGILRNGPLALSQEGVRASDSAVEASGVVDDRNLRSSVTDLFSSFFRRRQQPSDAALHVPQSLSSAVPSRDDSIATAKRVSIEGSSQSTRQLPVDRLSNSGAVCASVVEDKSSTAQLPGFVAKPDSDRASVSSKSSRISSVSRSVDQSRFPEYRASGSQGDTSSVLDGSSSGGGATGVLSSSVASSSSSMNVVPPVPVSRVPWSFASAPTPTFVPASIPVQTLTSHPIPVPRVAAPPAARIATPPTSPKPKAKASPPAPKASPPSSPQKKPASPPKASTSIGSAASASTSSRQPTTVDARFSLLVAVLRDFRNAGNEYPGWSIIGTELLKRDPWVYTKAGVSSKLSKYLELAKANGVIQLGNVGKNSAWMKLNIA